MDANNKTILELVEISRGNAAKIDSLSENVDDIMKFIKGDKRFSATGLAYEHKLLMQVYAKYKPQEEYIDCIIEDHKNRNFLKRNFEKIITIVGVGNILAGIAFVVGLFDKK